jgi:hypothetical protein
VIDGDDHGNSVTLKAIIKQFSWYIVAGEAADVPDDDAPDHVSVHPALGVGTRRSISKMADPRDSPDIIP